MNQVIDKSPETLTEWLTALTNAFTEAGFSVSYHPASGLYRLGELTVRKHSVPDEMYKITFLRKVAIVDGKPVRFTVVSLYNPIGCLTVNMKGFSAAKVTKIVGYADKLISDRVTREATVDAKRRRRAVAREQWNTAGIELPDWMTADPNIDDDKDAGTYHVYFHEHRAGFGLNFLSLEQVKRLSDFVKALAAEPMTIS